MKRVYAVLIITFFLLLAFFPIVLSSNTVLAQSTGYSINEVDHQIEVMYSGQVVVQDTIHVSGQITGDFTIGLPSSYSASVLKAVAYDSNNVYPVSLGVQLGDRSGFYGAEIDFNGQSPTVFTVAFVLSNGLISEQDASDYTLNFPAYPCLTQDIGSCNVTVTFPSTPTSIAITKSDGDVTTSNYVTQNLAAYTYSIGSATFSITSGTLQLSSVSRLNRQINIDPTGKVTSSDSYNIISNSTSTLTSFILALPTTASNIVVKDEIGRTLATSIGFSTSDNIPVNATLITYLTNGESAVITADYNLPSATIKGSQYTLSDFQLFPDFDYYVNQATFTFNPPEGATIVLPQLSSLDPSSALTRNSFQDTLTITRDGISHLDYGIPQSNNLQFAYNYNPVWVSFLPTFWVSVLAVIGSVGAVIYRRRKPTEKVPAITRTSTPKLAPTTSSQQMKSVEPLTGKRITAEDIREFTDAYEEKKQLNSELKSLDTRAQKGKMPRRQYKVQRRAIEIRLETIARNTNRLKDSFRSSSSAYADLVKQLDEAEEDLSEAEENIKNLESRQNKGEISIETYKKNIVDNQKRKDKAESTINGILLRLREKTR